MERLEGTVMSDEAPHGGCSARRESRGVVGAGGWCGTAVCKPEEHHSANLMEGKEGVECNGKGGTARYAQGWIMKRAP